MNPRHEPATEDLPRPAAPPAADDPRVGQAVDEYLALMQAGARPDRQAFLNAYPALAPVLEECLAALEFLHGAAPHLGRPPDDRAPAGGPELRRAAALGDFRIVREIGRGGMGVVYEAEQLSLPRRVALKVLPFAAALDGKQLQRFKNEAQAVACLHHPNIVPVYGVGCERGVHYYAMQFIEGQNLADLIAALRPPAPPAAPDGEAAPAPRADDESRRTAPFTPPPPPAAETAPKAAASTSLGSAPGSREFFRAVANLGVQAAEALEHAHEQGVIHRDIKPANLMVDGRGKLWVTDFGLAHCQGQAGLTMTGDFVGTLRYMSPEQALAKRVVIDHRTDVYSLGATLYELLTQQPVFGGADKQELLRQIAFDEPRPPRRLNRAVPAELETIVLKALQKNPADRYATAQELADDLRRYASGEPIRARRVSAWTRVLLWARRRPAAAALVLVSSVAALALVGVAVSLVYSAQLAVARDKAEKAQERLEALQYRFRIGQAHAELQYGNLSQVEALLEACPPEQRHWEWHYLKRQRDTALRTFEGFYPAEAAFAAGTRALSRDEARIAIANTDGTVTVYDTATRREILTLQSPMARLLAVTFSPDGTRLASICSDHTIRIWNATTGQELVPFTGHTTKFGIGRVIFSPDGRRLASFAWHEECVHIWDVATGQPLFPPLKAPTKSAQRFAGAVGNIAFSPDGARLASTIRDGSICIWDVNTGRLIRTLLGDTFEIWGLAFSPDGTRLASGGFDRTVKIWDVDPGRAKGGDSPLRTFRRHTNWLTSVAFSPNGVRVASASADGVIKIWVAATGAELVSFTVDAGRINQLAFSLDGARLISEGHVYSVGRGALKVWDTTTDPKARVLARHQGQSFSSVLSPDGKRLAFATIHSPDAKVTVLDTTTGQVLHTLEGHSPNLGQIAFSPNGRRIATAGGDKTVKLWDAETGQEIRTFDTGNREMHSAVAFSPIGSRLAMTRSDNLVSVWDLTTDQEVLQLKGHQDNMVNNTNGIVKITSTVTD